MSSSRMRSRIEHKRATERDVGLQPRVGLESFEPRVAYEPSALEV